MPVRVRFAPSPTGSLHLGNALSAVANRSFADETAARSCCVSTTPTPSQRRARRGGGDPRRPRLARRRLGRGAGAAERARRASTPRRSSAALGNGAVRDPDGSIRLAGTTLARADGSATYQLATVADDLDLGITHIIRGSDHRPNEERAAADRPRARRHAARGDPPRAPARRRRQEALQARRALLRRRPARGGDPGRGGACVPRRARAAATRRQPRPRLGSTGSRSTRSPRCRMPSSRPRPDAPVELARALRGARTLVEAREIARADHRAGARAARRRGAADARALRGAAWRRARAARRGRRRARSSGS